MMETNTPFHCVHGVLEGCCNVCHVSPYECPSCSSHLATIAERDGRIGELEEKNSAIIKRATDLISNACVDHTEKILRMGFIEFYEKNPRECEWCMQSRLALLDKEREAINKELSILAEFRRVTFCVIDGHWFHYRDNPNCKCSLCELKKLYYFGQGEYLVRAPSRRRNKRGGDETATLPVL